MTDKELR